MLFFLVLFSACVCRRLAATWLSFGVQLDYPCRLKSVSATAGKRVHTHTHTHIENHIYTHPISFSLSICLSIPLFLSLCLSLSFFRSRLLNRYTYTASQLIGVASVARGFNETGDKEYKNERIEQKNRTNLRKKSVKSRLFFFILLFFFFFLFRSLLFYSCILLSPVLLKPRAKRSTPISREAAYVYLFRSRERKKERDRHSDRKREIDKEIVREREREKGECE